jgi:NTE family protein
MTESNPSEVGMSLTPPSPRAEWRSSRSGTGLALSGGGFRATLFGLGTLWRLNEIGWFKSIRRITSVSGGSLTAGVLAAHWNELAFDSQGRAANFNEVVVKRLRDYCSRTLDWKAISLGLLPFVSAAGVARKSFENYLVRTPEGNIATLADLPTTGNGPDFVFYATCFQTGSSFRFSRDGLYDWKLGHLPLLNFSLGTALAASAAFPPFLSPLRLRTDPAEWTDKPAVRRLDRADRIRARLHLGDGGIYDNMATEALWKNMERVLISDAGAPFAFLPRPNRNWISQLSRVRNILIHQTRALRKRMLFGDFQSKRYSGAYWGISTQIDAYGLEQTMCADSDSTRALELIGTRLRALDPERQEKLINWGYALTDAAVRRHVDSAVEKGVWPYPDRRF